MKRAVGRLAAAIVLSLSSGVAVAPLAHADGPPSCGAEPTNPVVGHDGVGSVPVTWGIDTGPSARPQDVTGFRVTARLATLAGPVVKTATVASSARQHVLVGLAEGTTYVFTVTELTTCNDGITAYSTFTVPQFVRGRVSLSATKPGPGATRTTMTARLWVHQGSGPEKLTNDLVLWAAPSLTLFVRLSGSTTWKSLQNDLPDNDGAVTFEDVTVIKDAVYQARWNGEQGFAVKGLPAVSAPVAAPPLTPAPKRKARFVAVNAGPEPVRRGGTVTVTGTLERLDPADGKYHVYTGRTAQLQFRTMSGSYATVKSVTGAEGRFTARATQQKAGCWRWSLEGSSTTTSATAAGDCVNLA